MGYQISNVFHSSERWTDEEIQKIYNKIEIQGLNVSEKVENFHKYLSQGSGIVDEYISSLKGTTHKYEDEVKEYVEEVQAKIRSLHHMLYHLDSLIEDIDGNAPSKKSNFSLGGEKITSNPHKHKPDEPKIFSYDDLA